MKAQKVHVEFDGVMNEPGRGYYPEKMVVPHNWAQIWNTQSRLYHLFYVGEGNPPVGVTLIKESPKAGEVWEDAQGTQWFLRFHTSRARSLVAVQANGDSRYDNVGFPILNKRIFPPEK
jgi:hypothetical protein